MNNHRQPIYIKGKRFNHVMTNLKSICIAEAKQLNSLGNGDFIVKQNLLANQDGGIYSVYMEVTK